jgi:hypothetical protein
MRVRKSAFSWTVDYAEVKLREELGLASLMTIRQLGGREVLFIFSTWTGFSID